MTPRCPSCAGEAFLFFHTKDFNRRVSRESFDYYRCPSCGLIFLFPIPADLDNYYPDRYYEIPPTIERLAQVAEMDRFKIDMVRRYVSRGRLLEVGPAYGGFAYLAKAAGFEVEAIEMDARCCRFLTEAVGIRAIHASDVAKALAESDPYHVVALWHVIEHLQNPWAALEAIVCKLSPGGILVVASPNPDSFQFRILRRYWPHVDAPRHLELIPARLLTGRVEELGMETLLTTTTDPGGRRWNTFGWQMFLSNFFRNPIAKAGFQLLGSAIGRALGPIERGNRRGSCYTMIFRKKGPQ